MRRPCFGNPALDIWAQLGRSLRLPGRSSGVAGVSQLSENSALVKRGAPGPGRPRSGAPCQWGLQEHFRANFAAKERTRLRLGTLDLVRRAAAEVRSPTVTVPHVAAARPHVGQPRSGSLSASERTSLNLARRVAAGCRAQPDSDSESGCLDSEPRPGTRGVIGPGPSDGPPDWPSTGRLCQAYSRVWTTG